MAASKLSFKAVLAGLVALPLLSPAAENRELLQSLLTRSPFGNAPANATPKNPENQPVEFRAVMEEQGNTLFSFYETATKRSIWVEMNNPSDGFKIESYNEAGETITVVYQGRLLQLPLTSTSRKPQAAKVALNPATRIKEARIREAEKYHDKPFRLGHVAEETEIRRAVRRAEGAPTGPQRSAATSP